MLTTSQLIVLKNDILADPVLNLLPHNEDSAQAIALAYQVDATPNYIVWREVVPESDYTNELSAEGTTWSWSAYISRTLFEQNGWSRMFTGRETSVNPSKINVRQGFADIFSGPLNSAPAQRLHLLAISKRKANRFEKLFATGSGSVVSPSTMTLSGRVDRSTVYEAMGW